MEKHLYMYNLHKLPEGFIITSHEDIQEDDFVFANDTNVIFRCNNHEANSAIPQFKNLYEKLIAQQDQIDFSALSEEEQKKIGWFDVDDMARRWCTMQTTRSTDYWKSMVSVYIKGFQKAQELLASDRRFTLDDMKAIFYVGVQLGINQELHTQQHKPLQDEDKVFNRTVQSLSQKSWKIELDMIERYNRLDFDDADLPTSIEPKFIDGKIKITKIL
jgi:hypothetical protein